MSPSDISHEEMQTYLAAGRKLRSEAFRDAFRSIASLLASLATPAASTEKAKVS